MVWKQEKVTHEPEPIIQEWTRTVFLCDVCGEEAGPTLRIGNEVIAELCDKHALLFRQLIQKQLVTKPGPR